MGDKLILAIESSCDETSAAVLLGTKVLSNEVYTQLQHAQYGGVVPEIASRAHQTMITAVVQAAVPGAAVAALSRTPEESEAPNTGETTNVIAITTWEN